jgi:hypothetical protein
VANSDDNDQDPIIEDLIDDAIDARAKPVDVFGTGYFLAVWRPGVIFKSAEFAGYLPLYLLGLAPDEIGSALG